MKITDKMRLDFWQANPLRVGLWRARPKTWGASIWRGRWIAFENVRHALDCAIRAERQRILKKGA
jgi:hypothetical protein